MIRVIMRHKLLTLIVLIVFVGGGSIGYKKIKGDTTDVRYVLTTVEKGTLITSVSGSGQVSVTNQVDIKPKTSGDIVSLPVVEGQEVKAGTLLVQLDARDAQKAVRDAETNLAAARLTLEKLKKPADQLSILQSENALAGAKESKQKADNAMSQAREAKQKAEDDLVKAYEDGFNTVANAFLDLPTVMAGLKDTLFGTTMSGGIQENIDYYTNSVQTYDMKVLTYKDDASKKYQIARTAYDANFDQYKAASRFSKQSVIDSLIDETYETTKSVAEAVKNANNLIQFYKDKLVERNLRTHALADTHLTNLNTYTGKTNTHLLNLSSIRRAIQTSKETIVNADRTIAEKTEAFASAERTIAEKTESIVKLKAGTDALDLESQALAIRQRQNALQDAQEKLVDYFIRAPFDGVIATLNVKKRDSVSASTSIAMLITKQRIAEISLNEVDVAKIAKGQKATLTFDAVSDVQLTGQVADIDTVGTVSQGVVSYTVDITFDMQDERVKPGMSVSATIITEVKPDVLLVSNAAVKAQGNGQSVEVVDRSMFPSEQNEQTGGVVLSRAPRRVTVDIGSSNDDMTEIVSGLSEGDVVVVGTIQAQSNTNNRNQQQTPAFRIPGLPGGGGGGGGGGMRGGSR